ncbi:MAG: hypothetical protein LZF60_380012 [Nitrospira sp.]|nr:MAG: hypothetical protein LZF60_380012 [Nitrospira sp.]
MIGLIVACSLIVSLFLGSVEDVLGLECPKAPEQMNKELVFEGSGKVNLEWNALIKKAVNLSGVELAAKAKQITTDILTRLPRADHLYVEQMTFSAYCSSLRDDHAITESEKSKRLQNYIEAVRKTIQTHTPRNKKPAKQMSGSAKELIQLYRARAAETVKRIEGAIKNIRLETSKKTAGMMCVDIGGSNGDSSASSKSKSTRTLKNRNEMIVAEPEESESEICQRVKREAVDITDHLEYLKQRFEDLHKSHIESIQEDNRNLERVLLDQILNLLYQYNVIVAGNIGIGPGTYATGFREVIVNIREAAGFYEADLDDIYEGIEPS